MKRIVILASLLVLYLMGTPLIKPFSHAPLPPVSLPVTYTNHRKASTDILHFIYKARSEGTLKRIDWEKYCREFAELCIFSPSSPSYGYVLNEGSLFVLINDDLLWHHPIPHQYKLIEACFENFLFPSIHEAAATLHAEIKSRQAAGEPLYIEYVARFASLCTFTSIPSAGAKLDIKELWKILARKRFWHLDDAAQIRALEKCFIMPVLEESTSEDEAPETGDADALISPLSIGIAATASPSLAGGAGVR